ncbi:FtsX-like permease family protein [Clostridium oryzae]|uniref:FtsX-like permease family protein n=1 Tax=Clostridium oryzae TaxID=1450648 RepID=A0A1V4IPP5_9CLOT|nr:ABC transporter permease [Clostridium oryzae]OPJ61437.1 FtsX-like permease family protein [Clostridium oryzae]
MHKIWKLAFFYITYYKKQTIALFFGIVMSIALIVGIGCMMQSGTRANLQRTKQIYGDWHFRIRDSESRFSDFIKHMNGKGYKVDKYGVLVVKKTVDTPKLLTFCYGDDNYMKMMNRKLIKGHYPEKNGEVALDAHTITNLDLGDTIGEKVVIDGDSYTLCGIVNNEWNPNVADYKIFVSKDMDFEKDTHHLRLLYLKFDERTGVFDQFLAFSRRFNFDYKKGTARNDEVTSFVGGHSRVSVIDIIKAGLLLREGRFTYIWAQLNEFYHLSQNSILIALGIFGAFIVYSIFQVSIMKRLSQYSVMQVLGLENKHIFQVLLSELSMIFIAGYIVGSILGLGIARIIYSSIGKIFVDQTIGVEHSSALIAQHVDSTDSVVAQVKVQAGQFFVSKEVMIGSAIFMAVMIVIISFCLVHKMNHLTLQQMIHQNGNIKSRRRKIYSIHNTNMTSVLTNKFMLGRLRNFVTLVIALSIGGCIFIGTTYVTDNTKRHNELTFKADDGLNSDIQVYENSDELGDGINQKSAEAIQNISGVSNANPVTYTLGEIPLAKGILKWKSYFPETAHLKNFKQEPEITEKYNGQITEEKDGSNRLKVNVYGYDNNMLQTLKDYTLDGTINSAALAKNNGVILKTLMDGQGNYNGIDIKPGDKITVKVPKYGKLPQEVLKFKSSYDNYIEKDFIVAAIVSRPLAKNNYFIGDDGTNNVDIIMTNKQMQENFGIKDYNNISIQLSKNANVQQISGELGHIAEDIKNCTVKDYTKLINQENEFLQQKIFFFYGIAAVIMMISILHIMNSIQYIIASRRREFGIIRAMGITDSGFMKMLLKEGLRYGVYASIVMVALYFIEQKVLYNIMVHVYRYLQVNRAMPVLVVLAMCMANIAICIVTVLLSGKSILNESIIEEIV